MHILHIDLGREMRGGQHQVLLLLRMLRNAGHSCMLIARKGSPLFEAASGLGFNVQPAAILRLRRLSAEFDVVHAHDGKSHTWAAILSRRPFVVSRRVAFRVGGSVVSRWKYRRAARYLAVSRCVVGKLMDAGIPQTKIDLVYDAVERAEMQSWSAEGAVVALATEDPQKGRDLVERAAELAQVQITFSTDIERDLGHASVFVYISRSEGFGSAALVAMSMGVPVIASRIDGLMEVFEDGVSGLSVDNEPAAIAAAIRRVREDPELAQFLIFNARQRVGCLFSPDTLMLNTLASYRRALGL